LLVDSRRASSPSHAVAIELQEQLFARESELDNREGATVAWEEGLVAFVHALGEVHVEHEVSHAHANAVQWDFFSQARASSSRSK
jgi:hypothetical protein